MYRRIAALLMGLVLPGLASAEAPTWKQHPSRNKPRQQVMVQFTDTSLHPSIAQVLKGGSVSWVNYASMHEGSVVLSEAMAKALTCADPGPQWTKIGTRYQSIPVTTGGAMNDVELPCPLEAGEYEYEIWLFSGSDGDPAAMAEPDSRMQGKIIVE